MKIVSWNVAGFRACIKKGFSDFFSNVDADVICLQEVKALEEEIPFKAEGYQLYINPAEKKGYAGTLIYTRIPPINVKFGIDAGEYDCEGRTILLEFEDFYLINQYVPNVKRDLSRMEYRMIWEGKVKKFYKELEKSKPVIICGDFNVAHTENDIKNAKANIGNAGFTYEEREKFTELLESGFVDTYRFTHPDQNDAYTWWSFRNNCRERNIGWRLDYFLVSQSIIEKISEASIYKDTLGSDHCPIGLEIKMK
ncbi:MAG: exodeoxyribonuclease III [Bacilli bacterium]|nr:exodeoxyribonuclease III [Bacilli bacterium]